MFCDKVDIIILCFEKCLNFVNDFAIFNKHKNDVVYFCIHDRLNLCMLFISLINAIIISILFLFNNRFNDHFVVIIDFNNDFQCNELVLKDLCLFFEAHVVFKSFKLVFSICLSLEIFKVSNLDIRIEIKWYNCNDHIDVNKNLKFS